MSNETVRTLTKNLWLNGKKSEVWWSSDQEGASEYLLSTMVREMINDSLRAPEIASFDLPGEVETRVDCAQLYKIIREKELSVLDGRVRRVGAVVARQWAKGEPIYVACRTEIADRGVSGHILPLVGFAIDNEEGPYDKRVRDVVAVSPNKKQMPVAVRGADTVCVRR